MSNYILTCLPRADLRAMEPCLESVDLPIRTQLERSNRAIEHVYFLERGFASVVANGVGERSIEVGMIGNEGVTGLAVIMGTDRSPHETFMQSAGKGWKISASNLRKFMEGNAGLRKCLLLYAHVFYIQAAQNCFANGRGKLEERLARWLLMAQDRFGRSELDLTHEFLAGMLGVRRPGITVALKQLESRGLIQRKPGVIIVVDRKGLVLHSNGTYGVPEAEFRRLFESP